MSGETVKVLVRCRPFNKREKDLKCNQVVDMKSDIGRVQLTKPNSSDQPKAFTFDGAYFMDSTSQTIYEDLGFPLVEGVLQGYNGTVFAYGQTGCGKSFTMEGIVDPPEHQGITPRSFKHIFQEVAVRENCRFLVQASYLEIYNESIRDLLSKDAKLGLDLKEHPDKGIYVKGLTNTVVQSAEELLAVMARGTKNRSVGATLMNADSSRSHSIFTVRVEMAEVGPTGKDLIRVGKLNLVDLAGSERQGKTGATGARLKEATKINLSLSALGNVISALVDGKAKHIPYRDSKLTRLLQDSLGGNTKTLMVACVSPADNNYDETLSTLRYANRAKNIKNKAVINEDPRDALLREYQEEIKKLKEMLMGKFPEGMPASAGSAGDNSSRVVTKEIVVEKIIPATASQAELLAEFKKEKERDLKGVETRLKTEYDQQLQRLEQLYSEQKVSNEKLEQEFERLTNQFESKRAAAKSEHVEALKQKVQETDQKRAAGNTEAAVAPVVERPAVVVTKEGEAVQALLGFDGTAFKAIINDKGFFEPVRASDGSYEVVDGKDGAVAQEVVAKEKPVAAIGPDGEAVLAVRDALGHVVEAELTEDGLMRPVLDVHGKTKPIKGPDGQLVAPLPEASPAPKPIAVMNAEGLAVPAIVDADGVACAVTMNEDGQLEPELDANGKMKPIVGPKGKPAKPVKAIAEPVTVLSAEGVPTIAVEGPDGAPVAAVLSKDGRLRAAKDADGEVQPVLANGETVKPLKVAAPLIPHAVLGADGKPVLAVQHPQSGEMVKAMVKDSGQLGIALDAQGQPVPVLSPSGEAPQELEAARPVVAVRDESGVPVIGVLNPEGKMVKVHLDSKKQCLEPDVDESGNEVYEEEDDDIQFVTLPQRDAYPSEFPTMERAPALRTFEESFEPPSSQIVPATEAEKAALAALQDKLQALQSQFISGGDMDEGAREALREDLNQRRQHAIDSERERLRKAAEAAEDDGILEEIYDNLNDEIAARNRQLEKARDRIEASEQEIVDLQYEFEQERQQLLEAVRTQEQQLTLQEQLLDTIVPLLRRDCNYTNLDKIKAAAQWDDNLGRWLLPRVQLRDGNLPQDGSGPLPNPGKKKKAVSSRPPQRLRSMDERALQQRLQQDAELDYFATKRQDQILSSLGGRPSQSGKLSRFDAGARLDRGRRQDGQW